LKFDSRYTLSAQVSFVAATSPTAINGYGMTFVFMCYLPNA